MSQSRSIQEQIREAEARLAQMREGHVDAWSIYGSELCAGDMLRQEHEIEDEIAALRRRL